MNCRGVVGSTRLVYVVGRSAVKWWSLRTVEEKVRPFGLIMGARGGAGVYVQGEFGSLVKDEGVSDVLDVACSLEEGDEYYVPRLVKELGQCGFVFDVEGVEGMLQRLVDFGFVVV